MRGRHLMLFATAGALLMASSVAAQSGGALEFAGDDYVEIADPIDVSGDLTVEFWLRYDVAGSNRVVSNRGAGGYELDVWDDAIRFSINGHVACHADISAYRGQWVHIAATRRMDPAMSILYVDGVAAFWTPVAAAMETPAGTLRIGANPNDWGYFVGAIDEVRIFRAALDAETLLLWSTRELGPAHPAIDDLAGAWNFDEGTGQTAADYLGLHDGTLGTVATEDEADPAWTESGIVANEDMSFGAVKRLFR